MRELKCTIQKLLGLSRLLVPKSEFLVKVESAPEVSPSASEINIFAVILSAIWRQKILQNYLKNWIFYKER